MTTICKIHGKIRYIPLGNDGFDVSCIHACWDNNTSILNTKIDTSDDWWDTESWGSKKKSKGKTK